MNSKSKAAEKAVKFQLADPDSYLPTVTAAMSDADKKRMNPVHVANILALTADLTLSHMDAISEAFETNNGLEITFKAKLAREKDNLAIQFKPVGEFKDSASASVPDPNQDEFEFKKDSDEVEKAAGDDDTPNAAKGLPAPMVGLPAPDDDDVIDVSDESGEGEEE